MICRLCLKDTVNVLHFFDIIGTKQNIASVVGKHFWFEPRKDDPVSTAICNQCWLKVSDFHNFYESIQKAEKDLYDELLIQTDHQNKSTDNIVILQSLTSTCKAKEDFGEMSEPEIFLESFDMLKDSEKDTPKEYMEPFMDIPTPKEQQFNEDSKENHINPLANFRETNIAHQTIEDKCLEYYNNKETKPSPNKEQITNNANQKNHTPHKRPRKNKKGEHATHTQKASKVTTDCRTKNMEIDAEIAKYMSLHCELCNIRLEKFVSLKHHMRTQHKVKGYVVCCDKKFLKRVLLLEHIRKHLNVNSYKCDICSQVFAKKQTHRKHYLTKHQREEDKIYVCTQCPKKYARKYLLEQHKTHAHADRSTTCKICGRRFETLEELHAHNRDNEFCYGTMCDICAKVIRGVAAFQRHRLEHMGVTLPKIQCDECGSWHKDKNTLSKHKKKHKESKELHICDICQKISPSRPALLSHKRYVHGRSGSFECNICNRNFKKAIYLREHMAGHTGEVLYQCPHCSKTFNSNGNMHSHRKKMHPYEFEEQRKLRQQNAHLPKPPITSITQLSSIKKTNSPKKVNVDEMVYGTAT